MLRYYSPVNSLGSFRVRSVYLTTRLLGRFSPLSSKKVLPVFCSAHSFTRNWQILPFVNQRQGENDRRKYFMISSPRKNVADLAGVETATSWSNWDTEVFIKKTNLYNFEPLKPRFYIVKLGLQGYTLFCFILFKKLGKAVLTSTHNLCFWAK